MTIVLGWFAKHQFVMGQQMEDKAQRIALQVYLSLADHAAHIASNYSTGRDGYISVTQLRDDVLRDEYSASRRKKLWKRVEQVVEMNSNVRTKVGALDSGDVGRGWKWIGAIRAVDESAASSRRSSERYSLPYQFGSSSMMEVDNSQPAIEHNPGRWDEGRPAY